MAAPRLVVANTHPGSKVLCINTRNYFYKDRRLVTGRSVGLEPLTEGRVYTVRGFSADDEVIAASWSTLTKSFAAGSTGWSKATRCKSSECLSQGHMRSNVPRGRLCTSGSSKTHKRVFPPRTLVIPAARDFPAAGGDDE